MDSASSSSVLDTLRTVEFRLGLKGYNVDEVDEYLEKAAIEAEQLKEQLRQLTERLHQSDERVAQLEVGQPATAVAERAEPAAATDDGAVQRTLALAQRFVDQLRQESEAEAADRVKRAHEEASSLVADAEKQARTILDTAEHGVRDEVHRLEATRSQLAEDVEALARHLETERGRLRSSLNEMVKRLDQVQPMAALMALQQREGTKAGSPSGSHRDSSGSSGGAGEPASTRTKPSAASGSSGERTSQSVGSEEPGQMSGADRSASATGDTSARDPHAAPVSFSQEGQTSLPRREADSPGPSLLTRPSGTLFPDR